MKCFHCGGPSPTVICEKHGSLVPAGLREELQEAAEIYWQLRLATTAWISLVEGDKPGQEEMDALRRRIG